MKKVKISKKIFILIAALICLVFFMARSFSKYVIQKADTHIQSALEFYFESDISEVGNEKEYVIKNWEGNEQSIEFSVKNYFNKLLKTNEEISYKISAETVGETQNDINVIIKDEQNNEVVNNGIILSSDVDKQNYTLIITAQDASQLVYGKEYNVKLRITSISPYKKELVANIKLVYNQVQNYEANLINSDNGEYVKLNFKINNPQDLVITYNNTKLMLDRSSYIINNINVTETNNMTTFTIKRANFEEGKSYEITFIKQTNDSIIFGTDIEVR